MPTSIRYDRESITALLKRNPRARLRALIYLYYQQTNFERCAHATIEPNKSGFTAYDAETLTRIAKYALQSPTCAPKAITPTYDAILRDRLPRYWRQLLTAIIAKQKPERILQIGKSFVIVAAAQSPNAKSAA
jgi:hypothetical protein